jgi:hypothetical protein
MKYRAEAYKLLMAELAPYRELLFEELVKVVGQSSSRLVRSASGTAFVVDVNVYWNNQEHTKILVKGMAANADSEILQRIDESFIVSQRNPEAA